MYKLTSTTFWRYGPETIPRFIYTSQYLVTGLQYLIHRSPVINSSQYTAKLFKIAVLLSLHFVTGTSTKEYHFGYYSDMFMIMYRLSSSMKSLLLCFVAYMNQ